MGEYWSRAENKQRVVMSSNGDFEEGDVWSVVNKGREDPSPTTMRNSIHKSLTASSSAWQYPSAPKTIPRRPSNQEAVKLGQRSSAPVNIPDWSKIYGNKSGDGFDGEHEHGHGACGDDGDDGAGHHVDDGDDDDDDDGDMVPPHEWVAKRLARTRISPFSVCEGVGRTLKGRELSRVRNAILTKTGFLE
ncbi:protein S40-4-like [Syzygium oleosum]|uniref:protein S40-4-like n=1 Tax=Syzygium oleosum TaxID=219896 RepID=UPI0011D29D30|nr:protein S40-4-like [Syzygium oleosum]